MRRVEPEDFDGQLSYLSFMLAPTHACLTIPCMISLGLWPLLLRYLELSAAHPSS